MDKLFGNLRDFFKPHKAIIDSFVFRLHYKFTMAALIAFSIVVTGKQYIGDPIDCISKDDIPNDLLDTYCWIHSTFSIVAAWEKEIGVHVPYPGVDKYKPGDARVYHSYYQWVCFVLFLQGLLFYIPRYFWRNIEGHRIKNLVMDFNNPIVDANKDKKTKLLVDYLEENRGNHQVYSTLYVFAEALNFINVVGQIYLTDVFLGGEFTTYGIEVAKFTEWDWTVRYDPMKKVFPRMTKCTFYRFGSSGDVQKHDAMCLIPINIINEKIYIFLWFWFVILAFLTGVQLIYRIVVFFSWKLRFSILRVRCATVDPDDLETVLRFCDRDDWLLLTFLCRNMDSGNFKSVIELFAARIGKPADEKPPIEGTVV